jgi:hypothetical protein
VRQRQNEVLDKVVVGSSFVTVFYPGQCCPPEVPEFDEDFRLAAD